MEQDSCLTSGYDTISSDSDQQELIVEIKQRNKEILETQEKIKEMQVAKMQQLQAQKEMLLLSQKQGKGLASKIYGKSISDVLKADLKPDGEGNISEQ